MLVFVIPILLELYYPNVISCGPFSPFLHHFEQNKYQEEFLHT